MHRTDVGFLLSRILTTKPWMGTSSTGCNVWTSKVLLGGVVTSRKILSFLALLFVSSPCETQQKSIGPIMWARSLMKSQNTPIQCGMEMLSGFFFQWKGREV